MGPWVGLAQWDTWLGRVGQGSGELKTGYGVTLLGGRDRVLGHGQVGKAGRAGEASRCPGTTEKDAAMMYRGFALTDWAMATLMVLKLEQKGSSNRNSARSPGVQSSRSRSCA